jgi:hypothetical protein
MHVGKKAAKHCPGVSGGSRSCNGVDSRGAAHGLATSLQYKAKATMQHGMCRWSTRVADTSKKHCQVAATAAAAAAASTAEGQPTA